MQATTVPDVDVSWRPVALAVELARQGLSLVVVGGTARRLLGREHRPADLDVVVTTPAAVVEAAARLGARSQQLLRLNLKGAHPPVVAGGAHLARQQCPGRDRAAVRQCLPGQCVDSVDAEQLVLRLVVPLQPSGEDVLLGAAPGVRVAQPAERNVFLDPAGQPAARSEQVLVELAPSLLTGPAT
jgi:hypothetical protein